MKPRYFVSWIALSNDLKTMKVGNAEVARKTPITSIADITSIARDIEQDLKFRPGLTLVVTNWRKFEDCE